MSYLAYAVAVGLPIAIVLAALARELMITRRIRRRNAAMLRQMHSGISTALKSHVPPRPLPKPAPLVAPKKE